MAAQLKRKPVRWIATIGVVGTYLTSPEADIMVAWIAVVAFLAAWIGFASLGRRKQWHWIASIGGGFLVALLAIYILVAILGSEPSSVAVQ